MTTGEMGIRTYGNLYMADIMYKNSLYMTEQILNRITGDFPNNDVLKIGIYANSRRFCLDILVEFFDSPNIYIDSFE
jgi:hypothetical protein